MLSRLNRVVEYKLSNPIIDFEDIEIKKNAIDLLEQSLKKKRKKCMIGTGSMCDPYMHVVETVGNTRKALQLIAQ